MKGSMNTHLGNIVIDPEAVSYTHLDVYKRQTGGRTDCGNISGIFKCFS